MNDQKNFIIPIYEVANWPKGEKSTEGVLGEVPILQRGLVWDQAQIELLWDSILRGIPIGSIVLCKINDSIKEQVKDKHSQHGTHFILDGQQRCNAISLGFKEFPTKDTNDSILWLDLDNSFKNPYSTREFLVRLTTMAHPWGFNKSDDARRLGVGIIRAEISKIKPIPSDDFANIERFKPYEIFPFDSKIPIPMSFLLSADENSFWEDVIKLLVNRKESWAALALEFIDNDKNTENKKKIQQAISCALKTNIIALNVPETLFSISNQENSDPNKEGITNIEHLFQRLNRQGTTLDGEELIYSMIKSYFPEIAENIDSLSVKKMPSSKLLQLSIRIALSHKNGLKSKYNVSQIRRITTSLDISDKDSIINFIKVDLERVVSLVDKWMSNGDKDWGLIPVLKTSIAISSPDVYCLLMYIAWKYPLLEDEIIIKKLIGITLFMHWFVDDKNEVIDIVFNDLKSIDDYSDIIECIIFRLKNNNSTLSYLKRLQNVEFLERIINIDLGDDLTRWRWSSCKVNFQRENGDKENDYDFYIDPLLARIKGNRELLLYAQRHYLRERFPLYDPARKDLWKSINRPWDFDHILPAVFVRGKWDSNPFKRFCDEWINTNGNLRAWPFEDNRSEQAKNTSDKMVESVYWQNSFISENEKNGYSDNEVISNNEKAYNFAKSCKSRLIRIYKEWYDTFDIQELLIEN